MCLQIIQKISTKSWVYSLEIWLQKCEFALFYYIFLKKLKMTSPFKKITKQLLKTFLVNQEYFV